MTEPEDVSFPKPRRNDGGRPCGECRLQPGETCDICGAKEPDDVSVEARLVIAALEQAAVCAMSDIEDADATIIIREALLAERRKGRLEGLEEAASACEAESSQWSEGVAELILAAKIIRALKDKQP